MFKIKHVKTGKFYLAGDGDICYLSPAGTEFYSKPILSYLKDKKLHHGFGIKFDAATSQFYLNWYKPEFTEHEWKIVQ